MYAKKNEVYESDKKITKYTSVHVLWCTEHHLTSPLFKTQINRVAVKANNTDKEKRIVITILKERKYAQKKEKKNRSQIQNYEKRK